MQGRQRARQSGNQALCIQTLLQQGEPCQRAIEEVLLQPSLITRAQTRVSTVVEAHQANDWTDAGQ